MKTLVVYDTKHGATEEVAKRIAAAIREGGTQSELLDLRTKGAEAASLAGFSAVALGGPFYMGKWSKRAEAFASAREEELAAKSFALFSLGTNEKLGLDAAKDALPPSLAAKALSAHFGGRVDYLKLGGFERFIVRMVGGKAESLSTLDLEAAAAFGAELAKGSEK